MDRDEIPPHMNPMTPAEVTDLLRATLHGDLPRDTQHRLLATLALWGPMVDKLQAAINASQPCDECESTSVLQHQCWCEAGHNALRDLVAVLGLMVTTPSTSNPTGDSKAAGR